MRIYIPATAADLRGQLEPTHVHAVTPGLRDALPGEDEETLELVAFLAAADDSLRLVAGRGAVPRRVVVSADVSGDALTQPGDDAIETALVPRGPIPWTAAVSIHVDDPAARAEIAAAAGGDADAFERAGELDMLWFDVTERAAVARDLDEA